MKPPARAFRLAFFAGLAVLALVAAVIAGRGYVGREQPAAPETLEQIARKNDAAALNAAVQMEERSEQVTAAKEARQEGRLPEDDGG